MSDLGAVLIFPIVGYLFLQSCKLTQYRWHSLEWERNLFEATLWGAAYCLVARLVVWIGRNLPPWIGAREALHSFAPVPYLGTVLVAVVLALWIARWVDGFVPQDRAIRLAIDRYFGELFQLLFRAQEEESLVSITTASRKVYVGRVIVTPSLLLRDPQTRIVPVVSGYRASEQLDVVFTTSYEEIYRDLAANPGDRAAGSFGIVIPVHSIVSANRFDPEVYSRYFAQRESTA